MDLIELNSCVLMYKTPNNMLPVNVQTPFYKNKDIHMYENGNKDKLHVKNVNKKLNHMSKNNIGVKLWNNLDKDIRYQSFKRKLVQKYWYSTNISFV